MEVLRKELKPAEVKRRCICIPKERQSFFPQVGGKLQVTDAGTHSIHDVVVGSQWRLILPNWYQQHPEVCARDVVIFRQENGNVILSLSTKKTTGAGKGKKTTLMTQVLDLFVEALSGVEDGTIPARIKMDNQGFSLEWLGKKEESEVIIGGTRAPVKKVQAMEGIK